MANEKFKKSLHNLQIKIVDDNLLNSKKNKSEEDDDDDTLLDSIKKSVLKNHKQKRKLKTWFFILVMTMYVLVVLSSVFAMIFIPIYCSGLGTILPTLVVAITSLITAMLKIPGTIADYLFPKKEDDLLVKVASQQFSHDERTQKQKQGKQDK